MTNELGRDKIACAQAACDWWVSGLISGRQRDLLIASHYEREHQEVTEGAEKEADISPGRFVPFADPVNHPQHYTSHPSGVECITITEHMNFNLGNALKYIWRADLKNDAIEDLEKSLFYIRRELDRRQRAGV